MTSDEQEKLKNLLTHKDNNNKVLGLQTGRGQLTDLGMVEFLQRWINPSPMMKGVSRLHKIPDVPRGTNTGMSYDNFLYGYVAGMGASSKLELENLLSFYYTKAINYFLVVDVFNDKSYDFYIEIGGVDHKKLTRGPNNNETATRLIDYLVNYYSDELQP